MLRNVQQFFCFFVKKIDTWNHFTTLDELRGKHLHIFAIISAFATNILKNSELINFPKYWGKIKHLRISSFISDELFGKFIFSEEVFNNYESLSFLQLLIFCNLGMLETEKLELLYYTERIFQANTWIYLVYCP